MYDLEPPSVYVFERALEDQRSAQRIERMLAALGRDLGSAERVTDADIPQLVADNGWQTARWRQGRHPRHGDPSLVFATVRFEDKPDPADALKACPPGTSSRLVDHLLGRGGLTIHNEAPSSGRVCRSRYQFETAFGCPHGCQYCSGGQVAVVFTNLEELLERQVKPIAEQNPWQKVFMYNSSLTDTLCFEPEYGLSKLLAEYYATTPDQHYLIHTKSANVDGLLGIDHRGHTIVLWSLSGHTPSRVVEPGSATTEERIEAARKCQQAGYPVRIKFKPITPVKGWRDECREMVELLFARVRPGNIGLCFLAWMSLDELKACIDVDLLDPSCVEAMEVHAESMKGVITGPFPHHVRAEVYGFYLDEIRTHDVHVPVFLCTESRDMWREFSPRLGLEPGSYACACGPHCVPGCRIVQRVLAPATADV